MQMGRWILVWIYTLVHRCVAKSLKRNLLRFCYQVLQCAIKRLQDKDALHPLSTADLTLHLSRHPSHLHPCHFILFVFRHSRCIISPSLAPIIPSSVSLHPPSLSLTFCSPACPCSTSTFLLPLPLSPASLLPLLLPLRSRLALIPPRSHTQAASSPLCSYLHTHLSPLLSPPHLLCHLLTQITSLSVSLHSLLHLLSSSAPSNTLSPPSRANSRLHTHSCRLAPKDRASSPQSWQPGGWLV